MAGAQAGPRAAGPDKAPQTAASAPGHPGIAPILRLVGVEKSLGAAPVVRNLHLEVAPGEFLTLLGPSGCGKSTTLNLIAGLLQPDAGAIYLRGELANTWEPRRRRLGMVFQSWALFPHMPVRENIAFGLRAQGVGASEIKARVAEMLALVRLPGIEDKYPSQLSGGMQQRVALARALATRPDILLLDEPLSNLDERLRKEMQIELKHIHERLRVTTVFVTHSQEEALVLSDRVAVMNQGTLVRIDAPERLYREPRTRFICSFLGEATIFEGRVVASDGARIVVHAGPARLTAHTPRSAPAAPGQRVALALRPEAVSVRAQPSPGADNSIPARIRETVYRGDALVYYLDAAGMEMTALEYPKTGAAHAGGAQVFAEFDAAALSALEDA
jgi:ABC-type Fe3+/spermidine/putrescine transport system ATPase subunit